LIPLNHFFSNHILHPHGYCIVNLFSSVPVIAKDIPSNHHRN
jgi:hypothetical protein